MQNHNSRQVLVAKNKRKNNTKFDDVTYLREDANLMVRLDAVTSFDLSKLYNKMRIQDILLILHYDYSTEDFAERTLLPLRSKVLIDNCFLSEDLVGQQIELTVEVTKYKKAKKDDEFGEDEYLNDGFDYVKLGSFCVRSKNELKPLGNEKLFDIVKEFKVDKYTNRIWNKYNNDSVEYQRLHNCYINYNAEDEKSRKDKYFQNGMLKVYYDAVFETVKINDGYRIAGKASAMCSYIAIKNYMDKFFQNNNLELEVSNPNVFVKNSNVEFDALVIRKGCNSEYIFEKDDVEAVIEIKTGGFFSSSGNKLASDFSNYIKKGILNSKKYIYFSIAESFGVKDSSIHFYEFLLATILSLKNVYGVFCGVTKDQHAMLIPYEYDLDAILTDIFVKQ